MGYALGFAIFSIIAALISLIFILPMLDFDFPMPNVDAAAESDITVIIDAGHGGEDGGCEGNGLVEKDLNLDIALRVASLLEEAGINVVMTRDTDILLYDKNSDYVGISVMDQTTHTAV